MNNSYRSFMEQQCLSKQAKQAFYYNLQRGGHKNSLRIPIKAAAIAVCVILLIPITVFAAETIFDIGIIEIISGRTSSGKYGGRNGFETSYPSVSSRPLSDFSEKIRSVDGHTSTVYESWKAAEEDLGIILVNNTILSNESITKAYTYNLKAAGIKRPVHCYAVYNGKDHQLYRAVLTAAYRYKETHIALRATVTCKHPGIPAEEEHLLHRLGVTYESNDVTEIFREPYAAANGIRATIITVTHSANNKADYRACFAANGVSYIITASSYDLNDTEEAKYVLTDIIEAFVFN